MSAQLQLSPSSVHYFISTDVHPGALPRIVELFALRGITPDLLKVSKYKQTLLNRENQSIEIRVSGLNDADQEVILQKILSQVCVQNARKEVVFDRQIRRKAS